MRDPSKQHHEQCPFCVDEQYNPDCPYNKAIEGLIDDLRERVKHHDAAMSGQYIPVFFIPDDPASLEAHYKRILPIIREVARKHGYAIGVHGSMQRDLDLIAAPWEEWADDHETLMDAIQLAVSGRVKCMEDRLQPDTDKAHGRKSYTLYIGTKAYIDLSIMPKGG